MTEPKREDTIDQEYLSPSEAAKFLGVSRATLYHLLETSLPYYQVRGVQKRRIKRSDLEALLVRHEPRVGAAVQKAVKSKTKGKQTS